MITAIAEKLTMKLLSNGYLAAADREETVYGLFTVLSRVFFLMECVFFGIFLGCVLESVIFYFTFLFIKKYAGGYHASTEGRCIALSSFSILLSVLSINLFKTIPELQIIMLCASMVAGIIICIFSPVETKEKPLTDDEKKKFRLLSFIRIVLLFFALLILYQYSIFNICASISTGIVLECTFLIAGILKHRFAVKT